MNPCKSGTYGYIFHPSIHVNNGMIQEDDNEQYITKIQKNHEETMQEIEIGKLIQTIPFNEHFFAPIISSEEVYIAPTTRFTNKIEEKNKPKNHMYVSNKIRYVGNDNIAAYLNSYDEIYPAKKIFNTHLHLLDALQKLESKNIIHMDFNSNNIMWDDIQNIPIVIDFGLSRIMNTNDPQINKDFFISHENYEYWCIDIYIISQVIHEPSLSMHDDINPHRLKEMYNTFINNAHVKLLSRLEIRKMEIEYTNYFSKYMNQTWGDLVNQLLKCYASWDNYALSIIYLYIIKRALTPISINQNNAENKKIAHREKILQTYTAILKETMMSIPENRESPLKTRAHIMKMFS